jgi:hypothetical protein
MINAVEEFLKNSQFHNNSPFVPTPLQSLLFRYWEENDPKVIFIGQRQQGFTTALVAYSHFCALTTPGFKIAIVASNSGMAHYMKRISFFSNDISSEMINQTVFNNGSTIDFIARHVLSSRIQWKNYNLVFADNCVPIVDLSVKYIPKQLYCITTEENQIITEIKSLPDSSYKLVII